MSIWSRFFRVRQRPDLRVVVYSRVGCHLCEDAWLILERLRKKHGFLLSKRDIDTAAELAQRFDQCVPVVEVNDKVRQRGRFNEVLFRRILDAAT